jgi:7,8-dihydropterin-6-yl-methyl-4-(beta-D-ribofuranosyl)aminobenzene 5'-phosphate synthase
MEIKILFDNKKLDRTFLAGWGVSYLIGNKILFDTGEAPGCLFYNMDRMNVKIQDIDTVVISHDHFDHTGGLWELLQKRPGIDLYICAGFSKEFKDKARTCKCNVVETNRFMKIADNIYTTGQIDETLGQDHIMEQALVLETETGVTIMTGCAHPGIITIVEHVKEHTKKDIYLVMGGFHLMGRPARKLLDINNRLRELGVQCVGPAHCSGEDAESVFKKSYKKNYIDVMVGRTIEV